MLSHVHEAEGSARRAVNRVLYLPHLASQRLLVNSRFSLETIARSLPRLVGRARVLYNGVAAPADPPPPRRTIDDALAILYLGRLSPRKGPDVIIEAAALLAARGTAVEVTLLGSEFEGYEWYVEQLHRQVQTASLAGQVRFAGFEQDIWPALAAADVLVVPSRADEPFGNTAVEGLLARRPVVASDTSGLREAAGGYRTAWLVTPGNAAALAESLELIRREWKSIVVDVDWSRSRAETRHSPTAYRGAVAAALLSLIRGSRPAHIS